ncbi:MAG TPA: hypothetical protein VHO03_16760 [Ignavibacteriales bacterium]|nr:hypothetical protein [Ignavibacteriales bacterium]
MPENTREMPCYRCHKEVHALKIKSIDIDPKPADGPDLYPGATITPEEEGYAPIHVSFEYLVKHSPKVGGYFVVYADGYQSYSPALAFENGYTRIN